MILNGYVIFVILAVAYCNYSRSSEHFRDTSKWSDCYASENVIHTIITTNYIHCASMCLSLGCGLFHMDDDTCELIMDDSPSSASYSALFRGLLPSQDLTSKEVAKGRPVTGSQHYCASDPSKATDGDPTTDYHSTDSGTVVKPYLLVDLQGLRFVEKIRVLPNAGDHASRFRDIQILLGNTFTTGDFSSYTVVATVDGPVSYDQSWMEFNVTPPRCSRYVALYKYIEHGYDGYLLEVLEIEVMAKTY